MVKAASLYILACTIRTVSAIRARASDAPTPEGCERGQHASFIRAYREAGSKAVSSR